MSVDELLSNLVRTGLWREHKELTEDGESHIHPGFTANLCTNCGDGFIVAVNTAKDYQHCGSPTCGMEKEYA